MAFGNWDDVIRAYETVLNWCDNTDKRTRLIEETRDHATAMLNLIPTLRNLPLLIDVMPGTSHFTLFFEVSQTATTLNVWYTGGGNYRVYLYDPTLGEFGTVIEERIVSHEVLIATLSNFVIALKDL